MVKMHLGLVRGQLDATPQVRMCPALPPRRALSKMLKVMLVLCWKSATKMGTVARPHQMGVGLTTLGMIEKVAKLTHIRTQPFLATVQMRDT